ncbi:hypothetical protein ERO13_D08G045400v2 [Gossypium hirsutum]|uniref:Uncharacterized protein n=1 Tax=Gossypium hirsutum TaxID=3635 RepID=A0A1U8KFY9_GOSHI|nr:uncharacterized protein LOC107916642 [Gossypium hirsutum]KAG4132640.1 hypothetical protein ERO13_D08G045400v2 [Gossypium hirsutum]
MGNCVFKPFDEAEETIKVATPNGGIMELSPPISAACITKQFPGMAIYRRTPHTLLSQQPLFNNEKLRAGQLYYLLPLNNNNNNNNDLVSTSSSPYRMSFDHQQRVLLKRTDTEEAATPRVWKVKLVISPDKLAEIMAQEARTEALIESVRAVAKCGDGVSSSSVAKSDQWCVSCGGKGSLRNHAQDRS